MNVSLVKPSRADGGIISPFPRLQSRLLPPLLLWKKYHNFAPPRPSRQKYAEAIYLSPKKGKQSNPNFLARVRLAALFALEELTMGGYQFRQLLYI